MREVGIVNGDPAAGFWAVYRVACTISKPLAAICCAGGFFMVMGGNRHGGVERIKWTMIGFVGLNWIEWLLNVGQQVGQTMVGR